MNPSGTNDNRDPNLSSLYKAGDQMEPPAHFDDEILAAARKEVRAGPRRSARSGFSPWLIPLSTAAVLVLSVSVVTLMHQEQPEQFEPERLASSTLPASEDEFALYSDERRDAVKIKPLAPQDSQMLGQAAPSRAPALKLEDERKSKASNESPPQALLEETAKTVEEDLRRQIDTERARKQMEEERRKRELQMRMQAEQQKRSFFEEQRRKEAEQALNKFESIAGAPPAQSLPHSPITSSVPAPDVQRNIKREYAADIAPPLPQKVFDTADEWLEEIARLRLKGEKELADDQLRLFKQKYPDLSDDEIEDKITKLATKIERASPK